MAVFVQVKSFLLSIIFVVGDSFVVLNPPLPQAAKRYEQAQQPFSNGRQ